MQKRARRGPSMRARLILVPSVLLGLGMLAAAAVTLLAARSRIDAEVSSGVELSGLVIRYALDALETAPDPDAVLRQLEQDLTKVRHVAVTYLPENSGEPVAVPPSSFAADVLEPERIVARYPVTVRGAPHGTLVISTRPSDEAAEIWGSLAFLTALLGAIAVVTAAAILLTARRSLRPLGDLVEGLRRLRRGRYDALGEIEVAELREIGARFDELAASLARSEADNRLLVDRLMAIQDSERKALARELHDEFGAALFGIRAAASCIVERASDAAPSEAAAEIVARARKISSLADGLQKQIGRMLERVRPLILQRFGLCDALDDLVGEWRATHGGIECDLSLPTVASPVDEETASTIYRLVQEGLTNVARHSGAGHVSVVLGLDPTTSTAKVVVEDDGSGLPPDFRPGFGLLGMSERVRKLGGRLEIANGAHAGTRIEAVVRLEPAGNDNKARMHR